MKQLEIHFIKHRKSLSLDQKSKNLVQQAYSIVGGSETLYAALKDPNIEVPSIDSKIPKMDKVEGGDPKRSRIQNNAHKKLVHH
jgi:hypothetical protein